MADNKSLASTGFSGASKGSPVPAAPQTPATTQTQAPASTEPVFVSQDYRSRQQEQEPQQQEQQPAQNEANEGQVQLAGEEQPAQQEPEGFNDVFGLPKDSQFSFNHESAMNLLTADLSSGNVRQPVKEERAAAAQAPAEQLAPEEDQDLALHNDISNSVFETIEQLISTGYSAEEALKYAKIGVSNKIAEEKRIRELDKRYKKIAEEHEKKYSEREQSVQEEKINMQFNANVDSLAKKLGWAGYTKTIDGKQVKLDAGGAFVEFLCNPEHGIANEILDMFDAFGKPEAKYGTKEYSAAANRWFKSTMADPKLSRIIAKIAHAHAAQKMLPRLMKRGQLEQQAIDRNNSFQVSAGGESRNGSPPQQQKTDPKVAAYNRMFGSTYGKIQEV